MIGAWAACILIDDEEIILKGTETDTTNNRMELIAVIRAIEYCKKEYPTDSQIIIHTDSQYVFRIPERIEKLKTAEFLTKKGTAVRNTDLVKQLIQHIELLDLRFIKVKAHQKKTDKKNYNRLVDKLARELVREST